MGQTKLKAERLERLKLGHGCTQIYTDNPIKFKLIKSEFICKNLCTKNAHHSKNIGI